MNCIVCGHDFCWVCKLPRKHMFHSLGSAVSCEFIAMIIDNTGKVNEHCCIRFFRNVLLILFFIFGPLVILILGLIFLYLSILWMPIHYTHDIYKKKIMYKSYNTFTQIILLTITYIVVLILYILAAAVGTVIAILLCIYAYIILIILGCRLMCLKCSSN